LFAPQTVVQAICNAMTLALMVAGFGAVLTPIVLALRARGLQRLYWLLPLLPIYYCLVSVAAWTALVDLVVRPHHWIKTQHGLNQALTGASRDIRN
jgi:hypothetical protein